MVGFSDHCAVLLRWFVLTGLVIMIMEYLDRVLAV